jgi:hypothetical protein
MGQRLEMQKAMAKKLLWRKRHLECALRSSTVDKYGAIRQIWFGSIH